VKKPDRIADSCRILGVDEDITPAELKRVFHDKALLYHPDINPSAAAAAEFKNVTAAYGILREHIKKNPPAVRARAQTMRERDAFVGAEPQRGMTGRMTELKNIFLKRTPHRANETLADVAAHLTTEDIIYRLEHSQNVYVRIHAVRALALQNRAECAWHIIRALYDPESAVRAAAADALGSLNARFAVMPLIRLYQKADACSQAVILNALKQIDSPQAKKFLASLVPEEQQHDAADDAAPGIA
jgi:hypothetical protein